MGVLLLFSKMYPHFVRSLVISEPPLLSWLKENTADSSVKKEFYLMLHQQVRTALQKNDTVSAMKATLQYFAGADVWEQLSKEDKGILLSNITEWQAIAYATDAFRHFDKKDIKKIQVPILLITAENTLPLLKPINKQLKHLLPEVKHTHLLDATHDLWMTHPLKMLSVLSSFYSSFK